jgi:hypothetical protein
MHKLIEYSYERNNQRKTSSVRPEHDIEITEYGITRTYCPTTGRKRRVICYVMGEDEHQTGGKATGFTKHLSMKRKGKCIGKVPFSYKTDAIHKAKVIYKQHGVTLGVYECPTCLEFHLTTKYCNLKHLYKQWDEEREKEKEQAKINKRNRRKRNRMNRQIRKKIRTNLAKITTSVDNRLTTNKSVV